MTILPPRPARVNFGSSVTRVTFAAPVESLPFRRQALTRQAALKNIRSRSKLRVPGSETGNAEHTVAFPSHSPPFAYY